MQQIPVQFIQTQNIPSLLQQSSLKSGLNVFVRVLQNNGNGSYLVSFAGNRFEVHSERTLEAGQSFPALLKVEGQHLLVIPQQTESSGVVQNTVYSQLMAMGLPASEVTVFLVQFFQQTGLRIDTTLMNKALQLAQRFPGKEKEAAEAAVMLKSNGIEPTEDAIRSLLASLTAQTNTENQQNPSNKENNTDSQKSDRIDSAEKDDFLHKLYAEGAAGNGNEGLLAFMNHLAVSDHHWLFLPVEWNGLDCPCTGTLRLLLDTQEQTVLRMVSDIKTLACKYFFVLYYEAGTLSKVTFCTEPPLSDADTAVNAVKRSFMQSEQFMSVPVVYDEHAVLDGAFTTRQEPVSFAQEQ